ncbi:MAG: hypothetical protein ABJC13_13360, partial [Acidobacteriota bacterium]
MLDSRMVPGFRPFAFALLPVALAAGLASPTFGVERWTPFGPVGGVVSQLVQAGSQKERLYAATDPAGAFRSSDGGLSWQPIGREFQSHSVRHLAVDPKHPEVVLADVYSGNSNFQIWRSENGGTSFVPAARSPRSPIRLPLETLDLLYDATTPRAVFAATDGGIFRSVDGGSTWDSWALADLALRAIARNPAAPAVWYAATKAPTGLDGTIYRSTDGGLTWLPTPSTGGPVTDTPNSPDRLFFRAGALYARWNGALYRSTDGAATWTLAAQLETLPANDFAFSPSGSIYAATATGVYSSADGAHWSPPEVATTDQSSPGDSVASLALLPGGSVPEAVIGAGSRGIWRSPDAGTTWAAASRGLVARRALSLAVLSNPQRSVLASFADGVYRIERGDDFWQRLPRTPGYEAPYLAADPHHPGRVYALGTNGVAVSEDQGANWQTLAYIPYDKVFFFRVDPVRPNVLYVGLEAGSGSEAIGFACKSVDGGVTWTEILSYQYLYDLTFDPAHPDLGYRVTSAGLDKTTDGGETWTTLPNLDPLGVHALPKSVVFDPRTQAVYVGTRDRGVFRSTNGGRSFQRIATGLPLGSTPLLNPEITTLVLDRAGALYAGLAGQGVFRLERGQDWKAVNLDLPLAARGESPPNRRKALVK